MPLSDNPQGRIEMEGWIVGFVDGEGSFLVNVFRSKEYKIGWQVFPEFNVSQIEKNLGTLKELQKFFGCGRIYEHKVGRKKNWNKLYKFCVRNRKDLKEKIIPFFLKHPLKSKTKRNDFKIFVKVLKLMDEKKHLTKRGLRKILKLVEKMTHRKPFKERKAFQFLFPSETVRRGPAKQDKIQSDPCGDTGRVV